MQLKTEGMALLQGNHQSDLDFIDDIAAMADKAHDLQNLIDSISEHAGVLNLSNNAKKIKHILKGNISLPLTSSLSNKKLRLF